MLDQLRKEICSKTELMTDHGERSVVRVWYLDGVVYCAGQWKGVNDLRACDELFLLRVVEQTVDTMLAWHLVHVSQYLY